jgi:hypothetical protein
MREHSERSVAEKEADAYLSVALRAHARPRVRITDGLVFINGARLGAAEIYAKRIRLTPTTAHSRGPTF